MPIMEWRAVADGTMLDRLTGDGRSDHVRRNGSARSVTNAAFHTENSRNGLIFHAGGSGSSSDSDHHVGDLNQSNSSPQGADANTYDETQRSHKQGEYANSTSNGHLEGPVDCFSLDFGVVNAAKSSAETLEQHLHDVIRQREQLQRVEAELRAQFIARSEVLRLQNKFEEQIKQQASIIANLQEQLEDRDQRIHNLEQQLDEQEQQLQENQREANEAVSQVWAKDSLLREQTNELTNLRREYAEQKTAVAQFEVDRAQYLSQLQDLEEQMREKGLQLQEIDEQRRNTQEASMYKDKQLRDAQAWIQLAQELDVFHTSANSSLQAELRDQTDQINQLWIGHQRQLADVERFHCQTIQRLQLEVAEVREQNRILKGGADKNDNKNELATHPAGKDVALGVVTDQVGRMTGRLSSGLPALNNQVGHATGLPIPPSQVLGNTATILHVNQLPVLHQFTGQAQGVGASVTATSQFTQPGPAQIANPVILPAPQQLSVMHQQGNQAGPNLVLQQPEPSQPQHFSHPHQLHIYSRFPDAKSVMSVQSCSVNPVQLQQETNQEVMLDVSVSQQNNDAAFSHAAYPEAVTHGSILGSFHKWQVGIHAEASKNLDQQDGKQVLVQRNLKDKHETYKEKLSEHGSMLSAAQVAGDNAVFMGLKTDDVDSLSIAQHVHLSQVQQPAVSDVLTQLSPEQPSGLNPEGQHMSSPHMTQFQLTMSFERNKQDASDTKILQREMPNMQPWQASGMNPKDVEPTLLDEKSLLACLVRAIPSEASGPIKISTTLPNRLGKMLAPLHWHDYKKQYGLLDDFVSMHPELFVINGDFIHLREGAHAIISATTTVAKVAAAAAGTPAMCVMWPSTVAVTPVAQSQAEKLQKTMTVGQNITNLRSVTTHSHNLEAPEGVLGQFHINPSGSLHQDDIRKRGVAENLASHIGGGQRTMMLESRPDELSLMAKKSFGVSNGLDLNELNSTGFGAFGRRNNMLYGNGQEMRTNTIDTESFGKQDSTPLSETVDIRVTRLS